MNVDEFEDYGSFSDYAEFLEDNQNILDEIKKLSSHLIIVALYRIVELSTQKQIKRLYPSGVPRTMYRWDKLKEKLLSDHNINLETVQNYSIIDELRLLNNSVKHSGTVSQTLASYPNWTENEELGNIVDDYERISKAVPIYLSDLLGKILEVNDAT